MANTLYYDFDNAQEVIDKCNVCYMGMVDENNLPYVLPFNFGFHQEQIYLHSASKGKKIDILKRNPNVCISFSTDHQLFHRHETMACSYGMRYRSVLAFGKVVFIDDYDQKVDSLNIIMQKYAGRSFEYNAPSINNVAVYRVEIERIETKISGY